jgi:hypothetical protein
VSKVGEGSGGGYTETDFCLWIFKIYSKYGKEKEAHATFSPNHRIAALRYFIRFVHHIPSWENAHSILSQLVDWILSSSHLKIEVSSQNQGPCSLCTLGGDNWSWSSCPSFPFLSSQFPILFYVTVNFTRQQRNLSWCTIRRLQSQQKWWKRATKLAEILLCSTLIKI